MKNAAIYARVSTEEQAKHGYSIGAQLTELRSYADAHGYKVIGEYVDDGVSGQKGYKKRPALCRLLGELEQVDVILFIRLDRWFRSVKLYYEAQDILERNKTAWIATQEDYETVTAAGQFKVNIMLSVAQNEAQKTSERIKFVFDDKRSRGEVLSGKVGIGFSIENKKIVPNDDMDFVRQLFKQYLESRNYIATARWAGENGHPIDPSTVRHMLKNERYAPYVSDYAAAQKLIGLKYRRRTKSDRVYLFSGLLRCEHCGSALVTAWSGSQIYYYCRNKCYEHFLREDRIEAQLLDAVLPQAKAYNIGVRKSAPKVTQAQVDAKRSKLLDLYMNDLITRDEYEARYKAIQDAPPQPKEIPTETLKTALEIYSGLTRENKKTFWSRVMSQAVVGADNVRITYL